MRDADRLWVGSMPEAYDRWLVPAIFQPFAADLARRAALLAPRRVLEVAAGTGVLTRALTAALPSAEVVATDLNPPMVAFGAAKVPAASWRAADALRLPLDDAEFDLLVCQFGVMFVPDKPAAFAEAARVLAPTGRALFSTWAPVETHGFAAALVAGLERAFPQEPPSFVATVPHGYADPALVARDLAAGGLECVDVETVTLDGQAPSAAELAAGFCGGTPLRTILEARGDRDSATATIEREMIARLGPGPVTAQMTAHVFTARRAG